MFHIGQSEIKQSSSSSMTSNPSIVGPFSASDLKKEAWGPWSDKLGVPYFVPNQTHIVLAPLGHTTYLHCIVGNLGDRQVN